MTRIILDTESSRMPWPTTMNSVFTCCVCHEKCVAVRHANIIMFSCYHVFHKACLGPVLCKKETCPFCARVVDDSNRENERPICSCFVPAHTMPVKLRCILNPHP